MWLCQIFVNCLILNFETYIAVKYDDYIKVYNRSVQKSSELIDTHKYNLLYQYNQIIKQQALRSKFLVTAKGWHLQTL